ncbi:MAG: DEAD/DEAH box helicase [Burkholderiales bacterium]|nr:DEAD/DEAH box helicase [Burkholderiales bacterium]
MSTSFESLGLRAELVRAVADQGYTQPTPIQSQAIPVVLEGRDLLAAAQTGTGKTAGFTLPLLQRLATGANGSASPARHPVRALILVPTRELAAQVEESVRAYGRYFRLRSSVIFGGVGFNPQAEALRRGVDIVVATPGRLLDHVEQRTIDLRHVGILVLDEADRMLDMGFIPAIRRILALLPRERQNLLFSATFPDEIRRLAGSFMRAPATVEVAPRNRPVELISQAAYAVHRERKRELLARLVKDGDWRQVLVFTRTKHGANRLAQQLLRDGIEADAIHGNKSQGARTRALQRFKDGELRVLVATDIAARGLDIEELPHVVNYDLPHVAEDYVHRIGRTGRAGATGEAVSLVSAEERPLLAAIERLIGRRIEQRGVDGEARSAPQAALPRAAEKERAQARDEPRRDSHGDRRRHGGQRAATARNVPGGRRGAGDEPRDHAHRQGREAAASRHEENRRRRRRGGQRSAPSHRDARDEGRTERRQPLVAAYGQYGSGPAQPVQPAAAQASPRDTAAQAGRESGKRPILPAFFGLFSRRKSG